MASTPLAYCPSYHHHYYYYYYHYDHHYYSYHYHYLSQDLHEKNAWLDAFQNCFSDLEKSFAVVAGKDEKSSRFTTIVAWMLREGKMVQVRWWWWWWWEWGVVKKNVL